MPHVPHFPSSDDDADEDRESNRGGIIGRIIDGNFPTATGADPRPGAAPTPSR